MSRHCLRRLTYLGILAALFGSVVPASAEEPKKKPTLEEAYRAFHKGMSSTKKEEQIKALQAILPTRKDIEVLFPKQADIVWKWMESYEKELIAHRAEVVREVTRLGAIKKITKRDLRAEKEPTKGYKRVLPMIPRDIPVYELHVHGESGGSGSAAYLLVNERWIFFKDIDTVPEDLDKAKTAPPRNKDSVFRRGFFDKNVYVDDKRAAQLRDIAKAARAERAEPQAIRLSSRERRLLRWTLIFDTKDSEEYLKQMQALGAILAFPLREGEYVVVRDLDKRPAEPKAEDMSKINRIYWTDDNADSVKDVCKALGVEGSPSHFVAFFPEKLEQELAEKESKYQGLKADDIRKTRFKVFRRKDAWEVKVIEQKPTKP